jgi:hypothetical protein
LNGLTYIIRPCIFYDISFQQPVIVTTLPDPYGRELKGIAAATGIPLGKFFNQIWYFVM